MNNNRYGNKLYNYAFAILGISNKMEAKNPCKPYPIVSQNKKDTRQQAADSMGNTARRSNAVDFLFWLTI